MSRSRWLDDSGVAHVSRWGRHDHPWYAQETSFSSGLEGAETAHRWLVACPGSTSESVVRLRSLSAGFSISWNASGASSVGLDDRASFLDRDLIAYVMSVPGEVMAHGGSVRGLHRDAMTGILPEMIRDRRDKGDATAFTNAMTADAVTLGRGVVF